MDNVIILDKPLGMTSQEAVTAVKRRFGAKKAGHAGTLDPLATGVLLVCLDEATKISSLLMDMEKEYLAEMTLGVRTDTFDSEGKVTEERGFDHISRSAIESILGRFTGRIMQTPPMFSAIKHSGRPLYKLARKGVEVERASREVEVPSLELLSFEPPKALLCMRCSKGTYVRTLVDDIGRALGSVAHMSGLRRLAVGRFRAEDAATPDMLPEGKPGSVVEIDDALLHLPETIVSPEDFRKLCNGMPVIGTTYGYGPDASMAIRLKGPDGRIFAIGKTDDGRVKIRRMLGLKAESLNY
jgi:tRNA pseudouridine55 synthase